MNSSEIYLKISQNILENISCFEEKELNKEEFNNNLLLNLTFLTKFISDKNIQENPDFNFFIPQKNKILKNQIEKNIQKEDREYNIDNNENINKFHEEEIKEENKDLDITNIENITEKIEENFILETSNNRSIFDIEMDDTFNKTTNNIGELNNDFDVKSFVPEKNLTFDLGQSYVGDCSTIFNNDIQSVFDPDMSMFMKKRSHDSEKSRIVNQINSMNPNHTIQENRFKSQYNTTIRHLESIFNNDQITNLEYQRKKKEKLEEINGDTLNSNITEDEFNYLVEKTNIEYVSKMFEKYTFLREDINLLSNSDSFSSSKNFKNPDISLFCKKFSAMLLEIGCDKYTYDECLQQCRYKNKKFKFYDFVSFFDQLLAKNYENRIKKYKFLLYISKKNHLDSLDDLDLSCFFEIIKGKIIYDPDLYEFKQRKLCETYKKFFPNDKVKFLSKLSFLLEIFIKTEE